MMDLLGRLREHRLLAIVRGSDPEAALRAVLRLHGAGVSLIEVSFSSAQPEQVIRRARKELGGEAAIGAGTVLTQDQVSGALAAGAAFLVSPALAPALEWAAAQAPVMVGAFTPSEVVRAKDAGAVAVKLFPASLGGVGYLRALRDPFPDVEFVPVGGVDAGAAPDYLAAGAVAVGVGSPLLGDAASGGSLQALEERAKAFLASVAR
jgi:2-dehydro-3-deoxyphosphogluconate aldolase/(4S)-4-hydroxy-2-oxoglutarate aldolase